MGIIQETIKKDYARLIVRVLYDVGKTGSVLANCKLYFFMFGKDNGNSFDDSTGYITQLKTMLKDAENAKIKKDRIYSLFKREVDQNWGMFLNPEGDNKIDSTPLLLTTSKIKITLKDENVDNTNDPTKEEEPFDGSIYWQYVGLAIIETLQKNSQGITDNMDKVYLLACQAHSPFKRERKDNLTLERTLEIKFYEPPSSK